MWYLFSFFLIYVFFFFFFLYFFFFFFFFQAEDGIRDFCLSRGLGDVYKRQYFGRSDDCEIDIKCSTNPNYLRASRSVVRLLIAGAELCTGVLVNNTGSDYKAYVLTAQHC